MTFEAPQKKNSKKGSSHSLCGYRERLCTWLSWVCTSLNIEPLNEHSTPLFTTLHCVQTSKFLLKNLFQISWQKWEISPDYFLVGKTRKCSHRVQWAIYAVTFKCSKQTRQDPESLKHRLLAVWMPMLNIWTKTCKILLGSLYTASINESARICNSEIDIFLSIRRLTSVAEILWCDTRHPA